MTTATNTEEGRSIAAKILIVVARVEATDTIKANRRGSGAASRLLLLAKARIRWNELAKSQHVWQPKLKLLDHLHLRRMNMVATTKCKRKYTCQ